MLILSNVVEGFYIIWTSYTFCLLIFQRIIFEDIPTKFFFDLLQETDQEFVVRTGWFYRHDQHIHVPDPCIRVQPPYLPVGSRPASSTSDVDHR